MRDTRVPQEDRDPFELATSIDLRSRSVRDVVKVDPKPDSSSREVLRVYPERETRLDRDGLLLIDDGLRLADRGIFYKDHVLYYHRFFRSGDHGSSPNSDFLWRRRQYYAETKDRNLFAIAINRARLMPKEDYADFIELPDWRGPRFSQHMLDDPQAVGLTVVGREEKPDQVVQNRRHRGRRQVARSHGVLRPRQ
jgi:hypothetical protein